MARCVLHIGWHKTGTTSIQQNALKKRAKLEAAGIHYPNWHHNHGPALVSAFRQDKGYYFAEVFVPPRPVNASVAHSIWGRQALQKAVLETGSKTLLLSGEDLALLRLPEITALAKELHAKFETVEIVAYLRNHRDYLNSTVQQLVRMGLSISKVLEMAETAPALSDNLRVMSPIPEYGARLKNWVSVFGKEYVHIHNYDLLRDRGQDIVQHFFETHFDACTKSIFSEQPTDRSNQRFSTSAIHLLDSLHQRTPLMIDGNPNAKFLFNLQRFYTKMTGPPFLTDSVFEESCSAGRDRDRPVLEQVLKADSLARLYRDTSVWQDYPQSRLPEDIAITLEDISIVAVRSQAREKFFAALNHLKLNSEDSISLGNLHVTLFMLNDPDTLRSCAAWLVREKLYEVARLYLEKALRVGAIPESLSKLRATIDRHLPAMTP